MSITINSPLAAIWRHLLRSLLGLTIIAILMLLTGCSLPRVSAEDRIFLDRSLDFLGEYTLPKTTFEGTPVGGLSGITYDRQRDRFYAISDDHSDRAPARFYTLKLVIAPASSASSDIQIQSVEVEAVTTLKTETGEPYARETIDPEGISLSPRQSVFISSEGVSQTNSPPFINEFDLDTGRWQKALPIPDRYIPKMTEGQPSGIRSNLSFEALTLNPNGSSPNSLEPFRLFSAIESSLAQDLPNLDQPDLQQPLPVRFLHYLVGNDRSTLLAEHLYMLDPAPAGATDNGLVELVTIDQAGHFFSLERSFGITAGAGAKIFQIATGGATDTSGIASLKGDLQSITPIYKRLLLHLTDLNIPLDNLEGMALGPKLPDGSQSLLLVSDDNFSDLQVTQFLLFRVRNG